MSGYTKLYTTILDSSVWSASDSTRIVWITMLAMATPRGIVHASIDGLRRRANVSREAVEEALRVLEGPDPDDKSGIRDGRRLEKMQGSWQIINFELYRETKSLDALRKAQWRAKSPGQSKKRSPEAAPDPTPAPEAAPDPDPCFILPAGSLVAGQSGKFEGVIQVNPRKGRICPDDFVPGETHTVRCHELKLDLSDVLRRFKLFEFNRDYSDWDKRFSLWIEEQKVRNETEAAKPKPRYASHDAGGNGWRPDQSHRSYAESKQIGTIDFNQCLSEFCRSGALSKLTGAQCDTEFGRALAKLARAKRKGGNVQA